MKRIHVFFGQANYSLSLAIETFVSRATSSSGSPRNSRATIAVLR
jgi:hypothetical protein